MAVTPINDTVSYVDSAGVTQQGLGVVVLAGGGGGGGGGGDVNLTQVGGTAVTVGQKAAAASIPVVIASNQTGVPVTGPLTDTQLRATPVPIISRFTAGGNLSVTTNADGSTFVPFPAQACTQVTVINDTNFSFEVRQGGAGVAVPVLAQSSFSFFGATNANAYSVRRKDLDVEPTNVYIRWES